MRKNNSNLIILTILAALPGEASALEGDHHLLQGQGGEKGETKNLYRNLNKQKINIQHFYKLQHYGTVECINYTGGKNLQYLPSSTLKKFRGKKSNFFSFFLFFLIYKLYKTYTRKEREYIAHRYLAQMARMWCPTLINIQVFTVMEKSRSVNTSCEIAQE